MRVYSRKTATMIPKPTLVMSPTDLYFLLAAYKVNWNEALRWFKTVR